MKTPEEYFDMAVAKIGKTSRNAYTTLIDYLVEFVYDDAKKELQQYDVINCKNYLWIDINEQLPQVKSKVLVCGTPIGITTAYYWGCGHKNEPSTSCNGWSIMGVTHWTEIPKLPNGESEK